MRNTPPGLQSGQSAVELLALLPALLLVGLVAWQMVAAAHVWLVAQNSARAGARAESVGAPHADGARAVLAGGHARDARVRLNPARAIVTVRLPVPGALPLNVTGAARTDGAPASSR